jgi:electron transport complex protein RnfD
VTARLLTPISPHRHGDASVRRVMLGVLYALVPGIAAYVWLFGWGVVVNATLALAVALAAEAVMLTLRGRPVRPFLTDGSAAVTAVLLAVALPPLAPWWATAVGTAVAIVVAKHLYGGLGYNPFNPAMVGYVVLLVSFPRVMTVWPAPEALSGHYLGPIESLRIVFTGGSGDLSIDAVSGATALDYMKVKLGAELTVAEVRASPVFGGVAGRGWEWVSLGFLLGGLWLLYRRVITWHIPVGMLGALALLALVFSAVDPAHYPSPLFHLAAGGAALGAFFIATDPVSAATTPRGRLLFGAGVGTLTYVIRTWGAYPDAVAFSVLLMNLAAPTIDRYTQPRVLGHGKSG